MEYSKTSFLGIKQAAEQCVRYAPIMEAVVSEGEDWGILGGKEDLFACSEIFKIGMLR